MSERLSLGRIKSAVDAAHALGIFKFEPGEAAKFGYELQSPDISDQIGLANWDEGTQEGEERLNTLQEFGRNLLMAIHLNTAPKSEEPKSDPATM